MKVRVSGATGVVYAIRLPEALRELGVGSHLGSSRNPAR
jgi:3-polyprenyl-4-hydroxybenzoate decarboxylase